MSTARALTSAEDVARSADDLTLDPTWVKGLPASKLPALAAEIRRFLIDKVSRTGGHLGSNLGVVELTIALHRVFDSPRDVILFDTGHQSYVHKILTGRAGQFDTLRQAGGMSGYPSRAESPHDLVENSHASTALSYADGLAKAQALRGVPGRRIVAVVGDGALTGGQAWEALNNLGAPPRRPVMVVLNDNGRSYAPTVGRLARHLADLRAGVASAGLFEALGLAYLGPVDGHDVAALEAALRAAAAVEGPVVVHCVTRKGKGYPPAEADGVDCLHAVGRIDPATGRAPLGQGSAEPVTWTTVFADEMAAIGAERADVVCLTAAMTQAVGLGPFAAAFPDRVFDVGIAEAHALTSAAGLAMGGFHPVVAIYATFLNRAFDQIVLDVALHRLPVTIVCDRAGITGPDGPSHHGVWDASVLPVVPGLRIAAPRDPASLRVLVREAIAVSQGPTVVRYPKAPAGPSVEAVARIGHLDVLRRDPGAEVLLVGVGPLAIASLGAAEELAGVGVLADVVDPRWIAPVDPALIDLAAEHGLVVAVEESVAPGALGARIAQALAARGSATCAATFALPPRFLPHAPRDALLRAHGLEAAGIATTVLKRLALLEQRPPRQRRSLRMVTSDRVLMTDYQRDVADYWNSHTNDPVNLELGRVDEIYHHHYGIGEPDRSVLDGPPEERDDRIIAELHRLETAQADALIDRLGHVSPDDRLLDAGSGRGGTSIMANRRVGCRVDGVSISEYQVGFANEQAARRGVADRVRFHFRNMLDTGFSDADFAGIWTNETTMYVDLFNLYREFARLLRRGGRYVNITGCSNDVQGPKSAPVRRIDEHYRCNVHARSTYFRALAANDLVPIEVLDLTAATIPYWELRRESSVATGIEDSFLEAYGDRSFHYLLIVAERR